MAASIYIDSWKATKIENYVKDAEEISIAPKPTGGTFFDPDTGIKYTPVEHDPFNPPKIQFPKSTALDVVKRIADRDYPNTGSGEWVDVNPNNNNIKARYDEKGNKLFTGFPWNIDFKNRVILFLFLAYPAYLLVRSIVWATLTVRKS